MQITKFSDFALRILIHLSATEGGKLSTRDIAEAQGLSFNHLAKVAQWLAASGYVIATRGRSGGMQLAKPADQILIGQVLRGSEADSVLVECMRVDGGKCPLTAACGLSPILAEAQEAFFKVLDGYSLQDVISRKSGIVRLVQNLHSSAV